MIIGLGGVALDVIVRGFYFAYCIKDFGPVQMESARAVTTSGDKSSGGGVSLYTESTVRLHMGN
jgi:hypothetical protein